MENAATRSLESKVAARHGGGPGFRALAQLPVIPDLKKSHSKELGQPDLEQMSDVNRPV